jgi:hypothetical protein
MMTETVTDAAVDRLELAELTTDEYHRVLAADRRRIALEVLEDRAGPVDLDVLAEAVAERERRGDANPADPDRVAVSLHHVHLPLLTDLGIVDYDPDRRQL